MSELTRFDEPDPIYIRWVDSCNLFLDRWASPDDLEEHHEETFCETIGFLVAENDHSLYVAGSLAPNEIGSVMQIPRVSVKERAYLLVTALEVSEETEVEDGKAFIESPESPSEGEVRWAGSLLPGS